MATDKCNAMSFQELRINLEIPFYILLIFLKTVNNIQAYIFIYWFLFFYLLNIFLNRIYVFFLLCLRYFALKRNNLFLLKIYKRNKIISKIFTACLIRDFFSFHVGIIIFVSSELNILPFDIELGIRWSKIRKIK